MTDRCTAYQCERPDGHAGPHSATLRAEGDTFSVLIHWPNRTLESEVMHAIADTVHETLTETYAEYDVHRSTDTLHLFEQVYHLYCLLNGCKEWAGTERTGRTQSEHLIEIISSVPSLVGHGFVMYDDERVLDYWTQDTKRRRA